MIACPSCTAENSDVSKFCSECGTALKPEYAATVAQGVAGDAVDGSNQSSLSGRSHHGRFLPGTNVAGRYRIVSRLGKGGMGEVYRADDLKLGHTVALKFLPKEVADDPHRLEYFHSEVRLTRQIAHPNVCRVYDIGEIDGHHFLSMEYIDGEDLGVLLRRIGRLPADKGVQIAQQLCAGLAAAHDKGVLHRDLKPANIMLDGRGQVRITDFGLARLAEQDDEREGGISGTPAYMAPEQLLKGEATIQCDLYSLGLIVYELFTGERVYEGRTLREIIKAREESSLIPPSSVVGDMDPAVERIILRCLEKDPANRPRSAHAVSAALPGGDPLAAALAAGETPSPELVAASGGSGTLSLRTGTFCLVLVLVGLIGYPYLRDLGPFGQLTSSLPGAAPPAKLVGDLQEDILGPLGYYQEDALPDHCIYGLQRQQVPDGSHRMEFWYRQRSGGYLSPTVGELHDGLRAYTLSLTNPPPDEPGMVSVRVDMQGKLIELLAVPLENRPSLTTFSREQRDQQFDSLPAAFELRSSDYPLLESADYPQGAVPPVYADDVQIRRHSGGDSQHILLAFHSDRLVYFYTELVDDNHKRFTSRHFVQGGYQPPEGRLTMAETMVSSVGLLVLICALVLALRNLRLARADRRGAWRLVLAVGTLQMLLWLLAIQHVPSYSSEVTLLRVYCFKLIASLLYYWLIYLALEPYVRRYWPDVLIAWSRLLDGRWRDPLPARGLLIGALAGVGVVLVMNVVNLVATRLDEPAILAIWFWPNSVLQPAAAVLSSGRSGLSAALWLLMVLFLCRVVLRKQWLAIAAFTLLGVGFTIYIAAPPSHLINMVSWHLAIALVFTRGGLLEAMVFCFVTFAMAGCLTTPEVTAWYGQGTLVALGSIAAVALYGFYTSTLAPRSAAARPGIG